MFLSSWVRPLRWSMALSTVFSGVIEEINEEKKKLKVMVKIFGRKTPLELSIHAGGKRMTQVILLLINISIF